MEEADGCNVCTKIEDGMRGQNWVYVGRLEKKSYVSQYLRDDECSRLASTILFLSNFKIVVLAVPDNMPIVHTYYLVSLLTTEPS